MDHKSSNKQEMESDQIKADSEAPAPSNKKKRQRQKSKELVKEAKAIKRSGKQGEDPKPKQSPTKLDKDKRIPASEWKAIVDASSKVTGAKRCHYQQLDGVCDGRCGASHPMTGNH